MKKWMHARIKWLSAENGGRDAPVPIVNETAKNKYCPMIIFADEPSNIGSWSAEIYVKSSIDKYESEIKISYLMDNAPFDLFQEGASFKLFEGSRLVATGIICSEYVNEE